jgi:hypothetical protein
MNAAMYWKGMHTTIRSLTKSCRSCQSNKRRSQKYGHLPPKTAITNPWECLCVDLIGPYTLKDEDNLQIDFMALTMIDPTSSWFQIAELPVVKQLHQQTINNKELLIADEIFDKTSERTSLSVLVMFIVVKTMSLRKLSFFIVCTKSIRKYVCRVYHQLLQYITKLRQIMMDLCK